jgi:hypothetical protein
MLFLMVFGSVDFEKQTNAGLCVCGKALTDVR